MTYYCDSLRHLICVPYSIANLHAMAEDLNIKRCWFHTKQLYPHYDIPKRRIVEIQYKCVIVNARELVEIIKESMDIAKELTGLPMKHILMATKKRDTRYVQSNLIRQVCYETNAWLAEQKNSSQRA